MGQYVGGVSLPMLGVAGVSVPPELRGRGYARDMMERLVRDMFAEGWVLSTLFPSTQPLYRAVGYEHSVGLFEHEVRRGELAGLRSKGPDFTVRTVTVDDERVRAMYARFASRTHGSIDRGPYVWGRIAKHRQTLFEGLGAFRPDDTLAAYAFVTQQQSDDAMVLRVRDFAHDDGDGARAVLTLFDRFTTVASRAVLYGGPTLPLLTLLDQQRYATRREELAMTRIVNVQRALAERRYPVSVRAELALRVRDPLVPENDRAFLLSVSDGVAVVRPAPDATDAIELDVRWLAPLYMGMHSATTLAALGALRASPAALAVADGVFCAPYPSLSDYF
jgi:predicted acetyltransferase